MEQGKAWAPPAVIHLAITTAGVHVAWAQREVGYLPNEKPLYKFTNMRVDTIHDMIKELSFSAVLHRYLTLAALPSLMEPSSLSSCQPQPAAATNRRNT